MAAVTVSEGRTLVIQPWDKSTLKSIEKAILASDIGINPANDGNVIRLTFPQPTEERRRELNRQVSKTAEDSKVAIRSTRRDAMEKYKAMKKSAEITEDDLKGYEKDIQDLTDKYCKEIDKMAEAKEAMSSKMEAAKNSASETKDAVVDKAAEMKDAAADKAAEAKDATSDKAAEVKDAVTK